MKHEVPSILMRIQFPISIGMIVFAIVFGISFGYILLPIYRQELTFIAYLLGGGGAIYSGIYVGISVNRKVIQDKLQHSYQFLYQTKSVELSRVRTKLEKDFDPKKLSPEQFFDAVVSDVDIHTTVKVLLGLYEDLSVAVQDGFVYEPTVYKSVCTSLPYMYNTFTPYIQEVRKRREDERVYCEIEKLSNSWSTGKYLNNGKIIV